MGLDLIGFGYRLPANSVTQSESAELNVAFATSDPRRAKTVRALYRRTGVSARHSVLLADASVPLADRQRFYPPANGPDDPGPTTAARMAVYEAEAPVLAADASRMALADAEVSPHAITHLVTVSCTGFFAPGLGPRLIETIGLTPSVQRTHVGFMGCHGALNGLRVASAFGAESPDSRTLIVAVELCSLHFAYGWDPQSIVANSLFADGAAALVGAGAPNEAAETTRPGRPARSDARETPWRVTSSGTFLIPNSAEEMSWRIGDHGFRMTLSAAVPDLIAEHLPSWLDGWLADSGLSREDIGSWAVHPGGPRILTAVRDALGLDAADVQASRDVLDRHGNMSSATVLFIVDELKARGAQRPCVALAFGPGLVAEAILFR